MRLVNDNDHSVPATLLKYVHKAQEMVVDIIK